jgi:hypothetical protein
MAKGDRVMICFIFGVLVGGMYVKLQTFLCPKCRKQVRDKPFIGMLHLCE